VTTGNGKKYNNCLDFEELRNGARDIKEMVFFY
jgi:hypothetical protein